MEPVLTPKTTREVRLRLLEWFDLAERDLPWRGASPWAVVVSEFMLQQTPVSRVLEPFAQWMKRWPTPSALANATPGEAIVMWGRLGYPRRALRLHATAVMCDEQFGGEIPSTLSQLRSLPGVGEYTAAAIAAFAFQQRCAVLDTNVRRVHARVFDGVQFATTTSITERERTRADALLPTDPHTSARLSAAVMELGALVCTSRSPQCDVCPIRTECLWRLNGKPEWQGPARKGQTYEGTDRQCRGQLLAVVRNSDGPVELGLLNQAWPEPVQRARALDSLVADGLIDVCEDGTFSLPS